MLSILLLIIITAAMLYTGMMMMFGMSNTFSERAEELNVAHFTSLQPAGESIYTQVEFLQDFYGVNEVETLNVLKSMGGYRFGSNQSVGNIIIADVATEKQMNPLTLAVDSLPLTDNGVYIPQFLLLGSEYGIGDEITLEFMDSSLTFTVAGSTEDTMFGAAFNTIWRFYVSSDTFLELETSFPNSKYTLLSARMTDNWAPLSAIYGAEFGGIILIYDHFILARTFIPMIAAMMIIFFAIILLVVGSIVIRFIINNDIEERMVNIGSLKAIGYSSHQITLSIIIQFALIACVGIVVGISLAQIFIPLIARGFIAPLFGMPWNPPFSLTMTLIAFCIILLMVLLFTFVTSRRINKLHPILALCGGITTHSFKKNHLPLDKVSGSLNLLLAIKQLLHKKKQFVMLTIIIGGVTFSAVSVLISHYTINVNNDAFVETVIGYVPDVVVRLHDPKDGLAFKERMAEQSDVYSVFGREATALIVDNYVVDIMVVEDFSYHTGYSLAKGRLPILDSEIVLQNIVLTTLDKNIGDWVTVSQGDYQYDFMITGAIQVMGGFRGMINGDGMARLEPDFAFEEFGLYLQDEADVFRFIDTITQTYGGTIAHVGTLQGTIDNILNTIGGIFATLSVGVIFIVFSVVILVLYLIIKTTIVHKKRELGIQKAIGFTTLQLMNQIALNLTPAIILGVIMGAVGGYLGFNSLFIAISSSMMGITTADLPIPLDWVVLISIALILLAYVVSMVIGWRIRRISGYMLVSE
jgi:putative ABC transport system permease protein